MSLHSFAIIFKLMSRHRKELRGALGHGLCVNPSLVSPLKSTSCFLVVNWPNT